MTPFRRRVRYHQARWREAKGHPIGSQPIVPRPGKPVRPAGSRLPLDYARETGANFLTANALAAVRARTPVTEAHQSFDHQRLWADLLWSPALGFNLAGGTWPPTSSWPTGPSTAGGRRRLAAWSVRAGRAVAGAPLLLSMLQHTSGRWGWGRFVVVHPAGNSDYAELCARYRTLLETSRPSRR